MRLAVIGSGYVGLVVGACFSDAGNDVAMVDVDDRRIALLNEGKLPIYEPGLGEIVQRNASAGRLMFTTDLAAAVGEAEVVILAVGTPAAPDGRVDMQYMEAAALQTARALRRRSVIVTKSTVPVGTCRWIADLVSRETDVEFDYVSSPEFLKEGAAVDDFLKPDRVIVGVSSERALTIMRHLYSPFMRRRDRLVVMDPISAELCKYACNAMLATRISFMNELARLCEFYGADVSQLRRGMGMDHRIGPDFLYPSLGYGGSCFPKDVKALVSMGRSANHPMRLVEAVDLTNEEQRELMFRRVHHHFGDSLTERKFAVWGLAFKARTDDVRESPALTLVQRLVGAGADVAAYDPVAMENARLVLGDTHVRYAHDMYEALDDADALIICTEWQEFRTPDFGRMAERMAGDAVFDGRNLYDRDMMAETGLRYYSIGRPPVEPPAEGKTDHV
jgi:UDPglucose 6-dehydrogenase